MRALSEEAARVVRSRVLNPRWIGAMRAHGYKGAFELAATVDYLFGYDATTGVVDDWMYERVTEAYVDDPEMRKFFQASNPGALRSIAERLLEADQRGMWAASRRRPRRARLGRPRGRGVGGVPVTGGAAGTGGRARRFGFSAVVGHDDLKLALLLAAIDPGIGGVLLRGDKGSGKTTLARGLAALLPGDAPFVELPLGATEDRVIGSIDLGAALATGEARVRRGLLADADGGVLYVDEVNLLADHLVDTLLDVAVSGEHRLERDGVSVVQPARFVLVGTMNPEEGELRPQLLDRFGLCVTVRGARRPGGAGRDRPPPPGLRPAVDAVVRPVRARTATTSPWGRGWRPPSRRPSATTSSPSPSSLALAVGAEGLRADIVLCRAAAALAGWDGRPEATVADVERVAPLVLAHRRRRSPFDPPVLPPDELAEALAAAREASPPPPPPASPASGEAERRSRACRSRVARVGRRSAADTGRIGAAGAVR